MLGRPRHLVRFGSFFPRQAHAIRRQTAHSAPPCDGTRHFASLHFTSRWYQFMCSEKPICAPLTQSPGCFPNVVAAPSLCPTLSLCPTRPTNVVRVTVNSTNDGFPLQLRGVVSNDFRVLARFLHAPQRKHYSRLNSVRNENNFIKNVQTISKFIFKS